MTRRKIRRLLRRTARQVRATKPSAFRNPCAIYATRFALRDGIRWAERIPGYSMTRDDVFAPFVHRRDAQRGRITRHARSS